MSDTGQLEENLSTFSPLRPLSPAEEDAVQETARPSSPAHSKRLYRLPLLHALSRRSGYSKELSNLE